MLRSYFICSIFYECWPLFVWTFEESFIESLDLYNPQTSKDILALSSWSITCTVFYLNSCGVILGVEMSEMFEGLGRLGVLYFEDENSGVMEVPSHRTFYCKISYIVFELYSQLTVCIMLQNLITIIL